MTWYEDEVRQLEQKINADPSLTNRTVFYGSSSIRRWETLAEDFSEHRVLNLGFGGSTLAACTWFFERLIVPAQPRSLVFYAGDNDLGDGRNPEEVYLFFCAFSDRVQFYLPNVPVTCLSIKGSPARWNLIDKIRYTNQLVRQEIDSLPSFQYVDIHASLLDAKGNPRRDLYEADGLHLNAQGYAVWKQELLKYSTIFY